MYDITSFHSISTEFLALMKKVAKAPLVLDVVNIPGVQRSLERLADLLGKIQKALGEYLERERASFPRWVPSKSDTSFTTNPEYTCAWVYDELIIIHVSNQIKKS